MARKLKKEAKSMQEAKSIQEEQKFLDDVPQEYVFWCCDGRILRNIKELGEAFGTMTDETFAYHTNTEKNDFSNWVRDIIKDEKLAEEIAKSLDRAQAANIVAQRISFLSR